MKYLVIVILSLLSFYSLSQNKNKWFTAVGVEIYQNSSFNTVYQGNDLSVAAHTSDKAKYGYSFGINAKMKEFKRFSFSTVIAYSNMGFDQPHSGYTYGDYIDPRQGYTYIEPKPGEPYSGSFEWLYNYVDLGIGSNFNILNRKTKLYIQLQPEFNYLINFKHINTQYDINGTLIKRDSDDRTEYYEMSKFNFSLNFGLGCEFNIGKKINMFSQLNYKRTLLSPTPNFISKDILHSVGLKIGIRYRLN